MAQCAIRFLGTLKLWAVAYHEEVHYSVQTLLR